MISSLADGVTGNLLASAVAFVLGLFGRRAWIHWTRTRPASRLWGILGDKRADIVLTVAPERSGAEHTELVFPADAIAASEMRAFLTHSLRVNARILLSSQFAPQNWGHNLVVIGGPIHNAVTRRLLKDLDSGIAFTGHTIHVPSGNSYTAVVEHDDVGGDSITKDYGLVVRRRNPYKSEEFVTLVIGSRTFGCVVAARSLLGDNIRVVARSIGSATEFAVISEALVIDGVVQETKVVEVWHDAQDANTRGPVRR